MQPSPLCKTTWTSHPPTSGQRSPNRRHDREFPSVQALLFMRVAQPFFPILTLPNLCVLPSQARWLSNLPTGSALVARTGVLAVGTAGPPVPGVSTQGGGPGGPGGRTRTTHLCSRSRGGILHTSKGASECTLGTVGFRGYAVPDIIEPGST